VSPQLRIQGTVNTLFPQKSKHMFLSFLRRQGVLAEYKYSSSCSTSGSDRFIPKAALDRVKIRKITLSHIGTRTADPPARSLIALVLFSRDAYVA